MWDVIEFCTFEEGVKAFKHLEAEGDCKIVKCDDAVNHIGIDILKGKKLFYMAVELFFDDSLEEETELEIG